MMGGEKTAAVVVVGDVGRSPRIANHALSLAESMQFKVFLIGHMESKLNESILSHPRISVLHLPSPPSLNLPQLPNLIIRFIWTSFCLLFTLLFRLGWRLDLLLLQNPPALPAFIISYMVCCLRGARFVIDWHNYTWTMLVDRWGVETASRIPTLPPALMKKENKKLKKEAVRSRGKQKFVEWSYRLEGLFGRMADSSLCVSRSMQADLLSRWSIHSRVFYDRPPSWKFPQTHIATIHDVIWRLSKEEDGEVLRGEKSGGSGEECTRLTVRTGSEVRMRNDRPFVVISSTSWTPDEDFSLLFDGVVRYDEVARISRNSTATSSVPPLLLIITGKGPDKEMYLQKMKRMSLSSVSWMAPWLQASDYPILMAAADLGVCLHTSTSGLDLPMKVVDMFGSGVPVLAKRFAAIGELVEEGKNGHLFDTSSELADHLLRLATGHPHHNKSLSTLRHFITRFRSRFSSWEDSWEEDARPCFVDERDEAFRRVVATCPQS